MGQLIGDHYVEDSEDHLERIAEALEGIKVLLERLVNKP